MAQRDPRMYAGEKEKRRAKLSGEKPAEPEMNGTLALYWREIERYNRSTTDWYNEGSQIVDVYLDEIGSSGRQAKYPLLWSNVETLKPAVYVKPPSVVCVRRYKDKDTIARTAAELLERATNTSFELYNVDETLKAVRDDRLLPGRGQAWVRYEAVIEEYEIEDAALEVENEDRAYDNSVAQGEKVMGQRLKSEKVCNDYVHWKDFGHNISRTWNEVWMVWRIVYKTKEEVEERWGKEIAAKLSYVNKPPSTGSGHSKDAPENRARIYEIWDKMRGTTSWISEGQRDFIETGPPPIDFMNFFPCPEPCFATKTTNGLIPKPDYTYYRDQARQINDLTAKIHYLTDWLQVKAFVPGAPSGTADAVQQMIQDSSNQSLFVQVENFSELSERGGASKMIEFFPTEKIVATLRAAIESRSAAISDVYQITGISDILRGMTDPNETLGAQELKAQTGSRRIRTTRDEIARFSRDLARLNAEVIAEKFEPETIADITGFKYMSPEMMAQQQMGGFQAAPGMQIMPPQRPGMMPPMMGHNAQPMMPSFDDDNQDDPKNVFDERHIKLLRSDRMRSFRIDIETDSTIQADENAEKQARMEFANTMGAYMEKVAMVAQQSPELGPAMAEVLQWTLRGFRVGRSMEDVIEKAFQGAFQQLKQMRAMQAQQPNPKVIEAQMTAQLKEKQAASDAMLQGQKQQTDAQLSAQKQQTDAALAAQKQQTDAQLKVREQDITAALDARKMQMDAKLRAEEARRKEAHDNVAQMLDGYPTDKRLQ